MSRLLRIILIVCLLIAGFGILPGLASTDEPPPSLFLPLFPANSTITISGTVLDVDSHPIPNVTIRDNKGYIAVTDENGEYALETVKGENLLIAQNPGYAFTPEERSLNPSGDVSGQDFSGVTACGDIMVNGLVTAGAGGWDFPPTDPWNYATPHTDATVFLSAPTSGRTGFPPWPNPGGPSNFNIHSNANTQKYHIPSDANHVILSMHLFPQSTNLADNDRQYIKILDAYDNVIENLWNNQLNDTGFNLYKEFEINHYVGETIKIQIGTYNDGLGGVSRMYFDNVQLLICKQAEVPPSCNKVINPNFETGDTTGWTIPVQAVPPVISTTHAKSLPYSMKTGATTTYSFSEFYQDVLIPSDSVNAMLSFEVYTKSDEVAWARAQESLPVMPMEGDAWNKILAPDTDTAYAYVMDTSNDVLKRLLWWPDSDKRTWTKMSFDLSDYIGQTVRLRFGTFNDGDADESTMWVDDVYLNACSATGGCYEALNNTSFENNTVWEIPATAYSAGYTTLKYHTGLRSMRSGILYPSHNVFSYSDFRQKLTIPSNALSATLRVFIWPKSSQPDAIVGAPLIEPRILDGKMVASPDSSDGQYILVLNKYGYILDQLWWKFPPRNDQTWDPREKDLLPWKGQTIYLQFGVYNNGWDGITSMFVDDATVEICIP